jgi:hypothetical protein
MWGGCAGSCWCLTSCQYTIYACACEPCPPTCPPTHTHKCAPMASSPPHAIATCTCVAVSGHTAAATGRYVAVGRSADPLQVDACILQHSCMHTQPHSHYAWAYLRALLLGGCAHGVRRQMLCQSWCFHCRPAHSPRAQVRGVQVGRPTPP